MVLGLFQAPPHINVPHKQIFIVDVLHS